MKKRKRARPANRRQPVESVQSADPIVEVTIERILPGGAGLAHADGRTLLVALAAPGDRAFVRSSACRDAWPLLR